MTTDSQVFLDELRAGWSSGSGPDCGQLIALWKPREPSGLRPLLDKLRRDGEIKFNTAIAAGSDRERSLHGLNGIVGITLF